MTYTAEEYRQWILQQTNPYYKISEPNENTIQLAADCGTAEIVFHEMDIQQFCDHMDELEKKAQPETNLKHLRTNLGISQRELANSSGVPLRTIQQYEQRQKNINKAQVDYLIKLSSALHCDITALIERI